MIRFAPFLLEMALLVFCLIDAIQTPDLEVRNLPKWGWILLILLVPLVGSIAWLVAGRPARRPAASTWAQGAGLPEDRRPVADTSDIDARLTTDLDRVDREHEAALRKWQQDLEERERRLREESGGAGSDDPQAGS